MLFEQHEGKGPGARNHGAHDRVARALGLDAVEAAEHRSLEPRAVVVLQRCGGPGEAVGHERLRAAPLGARFVGQARGARVEQGERGARGRVVRRARGHVR